VKIAGAEAAEANRSSVGGAEKKEGPEGWESEQWRLGPTVPRTNKRRMRKEKEGEKKNLDAQHHCSNKPEKQGIGPGEFLSLRLAHSRRLSGKEKSKRVEGTLD